MRFAVLGQPVAHSKSPMMHAAAYRALGLSHTYDAIACDAKKFEELVGSLKQGDFAGFSVTVPHKMRALALADEIANSARIVGAANTLARTVDGKIVAHNTDVEALVVELENLAGSRDALRGKTAIVLGTGGAARAAIQAFTMLRCARIVVLGRNVEPRFENSLVEMCALGDGARVTPDVCAIVQATTCGMTGGPDGSIVANAIDWSRLRTDAIALDVVYSPTDTPFLSAARSAGLRNANGLGMLARQGALAFELWLGIPAPFDAMRSAVEA